MDGEKPEIEQINADFEEIIVSLGIPERRIEDMRKLESDQKWEIIKQNADRIMENNVLAEKCVILLERGRLKLEEARELCVVMRSCTKTMIDKFYRQKGFELMHNVRNGCYFHQKLRNSEMITFYIFIFYS